MSDSELDRAIAILRSRAATQRQIGATYPDDGELGRFATAEADAIGTVLAELARLKAERDASVDRQRFESARSQLRQSRGRVGPVPAGRGRPGRAARGPQCGR